MKSLGHSNDKDRSTPLDPADRIGQSRMSSKQITTLRVYNPDSTEQSDSEPTTFRDRFLSNLFPRRYYPELVELDKSTDDKTKARYIEFSMEHLGRVVLLGVVATVYVAAPAVTGTIMLAVGDFKAGLGFFALSAVLAGWSYWAPYKIATMVREDWVEFARESLGKKVS